MINRQVMPKADKQPNLLEHLSNGLSVVLAEPWLILPPVILDVLYLTVPSISAKPLAGKIADRADDRGGHAATFARWLDKQPAWDITRLPAQLNQSVVDGVGGSHVYRPFAEHSSAIGAWAVLPAALTSVVIGVIAFVAFALWLARAAGFLEGNDGGFRALLIDRSIKGLAFVGFGVIVFAVLIAVMTAPLAFLGADGISGNSLIVTLSLIAMCLQVVTMFSAEAIILDGLWPIAAIRASANVVFRSFWSALALLIISFAISPGIFSLWKSLSANAGGLAIAIVLNGIVFASLELAYLGFYQSRSEVTPLHSQPSRG